MYAKLVFPRSGGFNLNVTRSSDGSIDATLQVAGASFADPPMVYAVSDVDHSYVSRDTAGGYTLWIGRASFALSREEAERVHAGLRLTATSHIGDDTFDRPRTAESSSVFRAIFEAQGTALCGSVR